MFKSQKTTLLVCAWALAGCAGGGGGSSTSAPAPLPPAPPMTLASAPAGTQATATPHQGAEALNIHNGIHLAIPSGEFMADATTRVALTASGIELTMPGGGVANLDLSANSSQRVAANLYQTEFTNTAGQPALATYFAGPRLTYSTFGVWDKRSLTGPGSGPAGARLPTPPNANLHLTTAGGVVAYGVSPTQAPTTGSATFTGTAAGMYFTAFDAGAITGGTATLVANFANNSIAGAVTNLSTQAAWGGVVGRLNDIYLTGGTITGSSFSGTAVPGGNASDFMMLDVTGASGTFGGQFYGPGAAEVAGTFSLTDQRVPRTKIVGAFGATGQATPAGQPVPTVPTPPPPVITPVSTLADVPPGTNFGRVSAETLTSFSNGERTFVGSSAGLTPTASGFWFIDGIVSGSINTPHPTVTFDTSPGSPHVVGPNMYFAQVTQDPYVGTSGATTSYIQFLASTPLTYSSYGVWATTLASTPAAQPGVDPSTIAVGAIAYGVTTPANQVPRTGTATYNGSFRGAFAIGPTFGAITGGTATLTADFAADAVTGAVTNLTTQTAGSGTVGRMNDIMLTAGVIKTPAPNRNTVGGIAAPAAPTAATTVDITGVTGVFQGQFYGPNAVEMAGIVDMLKDAPIVNGVPGSTVVQGAFSTRR